jgi:uncharacterized protein with GYD domain
MISTPVFVILVKTTSSTIGAYDFVGRGEGTDDGVDVGLDKGCPDG